MTSADADNEATSIRRRAVGGAVTMTIRGLLARGVGFVGTLVLARFLAPEDFGAVALGLMALTLANYVADAGLGAAFLRAPESPDRRDLGALVGLQLTVTGALVAIAAVAALAVGRTGTLIALILAAAPIQALSTSARLLSERDLRYRPVAFADIAGALATQVVSIGLVLAGAGAFGLAAGAPARAVALVACYTALTPRLMTMPNLRFRRLRPYLGLGAAFQAGWVIEVVRYNVLAAGVASIGGLSLLGLMSLAERLIQPVQLVVENLARVAFPAFSRTASTDRAIDGDLLLRTTRLVAVPIWFALTIVVSASLGLMTLLLGEQWADAVDLLPFFCFRIGLTAPIIVVFTMYLYSVGQGRLVVSLGALGGVVNVAVSLAGAATLGATGIGLGFVASALVELAIVEPLFRRRLGRSTLGSFLAPVAVGLAAVAAAVGTQEALGAGWAASVAAVAVGAAVFAALVAAFLRPVVLEVRRLLVRR